MILLRMSLNDNIISKIEHSDWFAKMLASDVDIGLIGEMDRSKVGVVFFKIENFHTLVSINLNPLYRGKKLAGTLLRNAMQDAQKMSPNIDHFVAEIKNTNTASIKVFCQNGFTLNSKKDHSGIYAQSVDLELKQMFQIDEREISQTCHRILLLKFRQIITAK